MGFPCVMAASSSDLICFTLLLLLEFAAFELLLSSLAWIYGAEEIGCRVAISWLRLGWSLGERLSADSGGPDLIFFLPKIGCESICGYAGRTDMPGLPRIWPARPEEITIPQWREKLAINELKWAPEKRSIIWKVEGIYCHSLLIVCPSPQHRMSPAMVTVWIYGQ